MAKRKTTKGEDVPKSGMTAALWKRFLELIIAGCKRAEAEKDVGLSSYCVQQHLITNSKAKEEYAAAQLAWMRSEQDPEVIEGVLAGIMAGLTMGKACAPFMIEPSKVYNWILKDPIWNEEYENAREIQAEKMLDDALDIAADGTNDLGVDAKGNVRTDHDVIQRSKLRVDQRRWQMGKMNFKRYGDKQQVDQHITQHVDQVEVLDKARRRKDAAAQKRKDTRDANASKEIVDPAVPTVH